MSKNCRNCFNEAAGICACTESLYFKEQIPPYVEETEESDDWLDAKVDGVSVEGIPLDGHYIDHLINYL